MVRENKENIFKKIVSYHKRASSQVTQRDIENIDYLAKQVKPFVDKNAMILGIDKSARLTVFGLREALKLKGSKPNNPVFMNYSVYKTKEYDKHFYENVPEKERVKIIAERIKENKKQGKLKGVDKILIVDAFAYTGQTLSDIKKAFKLAAPEIKIKTAALEVSKGAKTDYAALRTTPRNDFGAVDAPIIDEKIKEKREGKVIITTRTARANKKAYFYSENPDYTIWRRSYKKKREKVKKGLQTLNRRRR